MSGTDAHGEVTFEELIEEHSATNAAEFERVITSGDRGKMLRFVYDVPVLIDEANAPSIFKKGALGYELDAKSKRLAEIHGTPAKNARGDLPAILLSPEGDPEYGAVESQSLAMTRSIGDYYMQTFGVTWRPEVVSVDLGEVIQELEHLTLIIASDGVRHPRSPLPFVGNVAFYPDQPPFCHSRFGTYGTTKTCSTQYHARRTGRACRKPTWLRPFSGARCRAAPRCSVTLRII